MTFFPQQTYFDLFLINFLYFSNDTLIPHIPLGVPDRLIHFWPMCLSDEGAIDTKYEIPLSAAKQLLPLIMSKYELFDTVNTRRV